MRDVLRTTLPMAIRRQPLSVQLAIHIGSVVTVAVADPHLMLRSWGRCAVQLPVPGRRVVEGVLRPRVSMATSLRRGIHGQGIRRRHMERARGCVAK